MKQKLILLALVIGLTIVSQSTLSLGMGNIQVYTSLDEPLRATIELMSNPEEDLQNLTVKLASSDDYKKVGLDKSFVPSNILVSLDEDNPYLIKVTSNGPISEPIISLLLDVDWNNGRILREFTVLLDPPVYDVPSSDVQVNRVVVEPIQEQTADEPSLTARETESTEDTQQVYTNEDVAKYQDSTTETTAETTASSQDNEAEYNLEPQNNQVYVNAGDTLWRIANQNKIGGLSANQMMIAIYNNNPSAFIDNNINKMIKGSQLNMPTLSQAEAISYNEALQQVQSHNDSWAPAETDYSSYQTTDTDDDIYDDSTSTLDYGVELSGGDSEGSDNGQSNAEVGDNESAQLTPEEQYNQEAENQDLQERISELEDIVEQQQSVLEIEDSSLANLENQLGEAGEDVDQNPEDMVDDVWDTSTEDAEDATTDESLDLDITAVDSNEDAEGMVDDMVDPVEDTTTESMTDDENESVDDAENMVDQVDTPVKEEKAIPKFSGNAKQEASFVDQAINWVMDNLKWVLIGLGGLIVLILIPKFLRKDSADEETSFLDDIKQRKSEETEAEFDEDFDDSADTKMNQPLLDSEETSLDEEGNEDSEDVLAELDKSISFEDDMNETDFDEDDDPFESSDIEASDDDSFDLDGFLNDEEPTSTDNSITADHSKTLAGVDFGDDDDEDFEDVSFDDLGSDLDEELLEKDSDEAEDEFNLDDDAMDSAEEATEEIEESMSLDDELDEFDLDGFDLDDADEEPAVTESDDAKNDTDSDDDSDEMFDLDEDLDFDLSDDLAEIEAEDDDIEDADDSEAEETLSLDDTDDDDFDDLLELSDDDETFDTDGDASMDEEIDLGLEGLLDEGDAIDTKLDLAKAYLDMGDVDGARNLLEEVVSEGNDTQIEEAKKILGDM